MSDDKVLTFRTYLERLKEDVNNALDRFNDLTSDQASSVCQSFGVVDVIRSLENVQKLKEAICNKEFDDADQASERDKKVVELQEARAYIEKLQTERKRFEKETKHRSVDVVQDTDEAQPYHSDDYDGDDFDKEENTQYNAPESYLDTFKDEVLYNRDVYDRQAKRKGDWVDSEDDDSEPDSDVEFSEMELPTLLTQIQNILNEYPDDGQIIKELVQNADDAKASSIKILYDGRSLQVPSQPRNRYSKFFTAPALVVYNNAEFTDEDWSGIKRVYNSVKADDPLRVGRFGLGFKSVFHITDNPCIVSGKKILFMNPLSKNPGKVCVTRSLNKLERGRGVNVEECLDAFEGIFGFGRDTLNSGNYPGTMFWFPLRCKESKLSTNIYIDSKIIDLFRALYSDSSRNMLFLRCIHNVSLYMDAPVLASSQSCSTTSDFSADQINLGKNKPFYTAAIHDENEESEQCRKTFERTIQTTGLDVADSPTHFSCLAIVSTQLNFVSGQSVETNAKWFIINYLHGGHVSEDLRLLLKDDSLGYLPIGGIAAKVNTSSDKMDESGHIFCYQPLPQDKDSYTGLPVHVNAFFALTQNRRHVKWPTADQEQHQMHTDSTIRWNKVIVEEILPEAYCLFIEELQKVCVRQGNPTNLVQFVFSVIPDLHKTTERWRNLANKALEIVHQKSVMVLYTKNAGGQWISANDSMIVPANSLPLTDNECMDCIVRLLLKDGVNVVCAPEHVSGPRLTERNLISPPFLRDHLRKSHTYESMEKREKFFLLEFICRNKNINDLQDIQIIPLDDGNFMSLNDHRAIFVSNPDVIQLFPGQEAAFLSNEIPEALTDYFNGIARTGECSIKYLDAESTANLIQKTIVQLNKFDWEAWLKRIWDHIHFEYPSQVDSFKHLTLIPVRLEDTESMELHALSEKILLRLQTDGSMLSDDICKAFRLLSIVILAEKPCWIQPDLSNYFYNASCSSLLEIFEHVSQDDLQKANKGLSHDAKMALSDFLVEMLSTVTPKARENLRTLKIFKQSRSILSECSIVSVEENCTIFSADDYPVELPIPVLVLSKNECVFVEKLGGKIIREEDMIMHTCEKFELYCVSDQKSFILWLLNKLHWKKDVRIQQFLQTFKYLRASDDNMYAPKELFDPTIAKLKALFSNESVFPVDEDFLKDECMLALRSFGLKGENQISVSDVERTCAYIDKLSEENDLHVRTKAVAVLEVMENRKEFLEQCSFERYRFVPVNKERPHSYPSHVPYKSECSKTIVRPSEVTALDHVNLVGSILPVVDCQNFPSVAKHFKWLQEPPTSVVVQHLHSLSSSYESRYKPSVLSILLELYTFLKAKPDFEETKRNLIDTFTDKGFVWYGDGFVTPECIFVEADKDEIDLKPYLRPLPSELLHFKDFFKRLGCFESIDINACLHILERLREDSGKEIYHVSPLVVRNMSIAILNKLKNDNTDILLSLEGQIYIPIQTEDEKLVQFRYAHQCVYCDASWLKEEIEDDDEEEIIFAHKDIPVSTATALGLPALSQKVFADSDAMEEWGQDEPLTRRLRNILEEGYVDGFSVPKELFQNADDAGASKLWILYDERENEDSRKNLLSAGMAEWQGPALWVYNDAEFTEKDFENITKLSGATKESDPCTIGKFGLGFCSVYNLTDVPSLISGENIVVFDPHMKYLGKALPGKSPGLKINVKKMKSSTLTKKVRNQFRPAVDIFGCKSTTDEDFHFRGTLFRFPLRSHSSEISDIQYTSDKVQKLLKMIYGTAANLLLFNQHVSEIKVFHLPNGGNPRNPALLFETRKHTKVMHTCHTGSVLKEAAARKQTNELHSKQLQIIVKVHISSNGPKSEKSETDWLISWATGVKEDTLKLAMEEEGAVPIGAVAVPCTYQNGEMMPILMNDLPDGFYKEGHLFVFLPLPSVHGFPFHINATFAVSSDRRQLRKVTGDDSEKKFENWNKYLLGDSVNEALILLLKNMKNLNMSPAYEHYTIWPLHHSEEIEDELRICFYKSAVEEGQLQIFFNSGKWFDISKCKFIEPSLKKHEVFGKCTNDLFKKLQPNENIVNLPEAYYEQLQFADEQIVQRHTISTKRFIVDVLLSNLSLLSNTIPEDIRNKYIRFALHMQDSDVNEYMKNIKCIPAKPNGELRYIKDIVDHRSKISCLFDVHDERFAADEFTDEKSCKILKSHGMLHDTLTDKDVLDRINSVSELNRQCAYCAVERCNNLLKYLEENHQRFEAVLQKVRNQPFLPVASKPDGWVNKTEEELSDYQLCIRHKNKMLNNCQIDVVDMRSKVKHDNPVFDESNKQHSHRHSISPSEVTSDKFVELIISVSPVVSCNSIPNVAEKFGWFAQPKLEKVVQHFANIVERYEACLKSRFLPMVISIYQCFESTYEFVDVQHSLKRLFEEHKSGCVWSGDEFMAPGCIYIDHQADDIDLQPFFKHLPSELAHLKDFFSNLGCAREIDNKVCLSVLEQLKIESEEHQYKLSASSLRSLAITILNKIKHELTEIRSDTSVKLYIPITSDDESNASFALLEQCVFHDDNWFMDQESLDEGDRNLHFVHNDIPKATLEALEVPSITQKMFTDSDAMEEWGQDEPLTRRLRNILEEGYVDGFSVPKELFQNADDAGASKLWILYDERENEDSRKNLLSAGMAEWQGPALWVYNDAEFTEKDFENITKLSGATKESDPCTIGKFGLGFCAVYNLTDVPSLISGKNVVIFDPHMKYLGKSLPGKSPGLKIDVKKMKYETFAKRVCNQFKPAENIFGCDLFSKDRKYFGGTLFRFPLRTQPSDISDKIYSDAEIKKLIRITSECAANMLLFNMNVKEFKIFHLSKNNYNPKDATLLFEASKTVSAVYPNKVASPRTTSILKEASKRKQYKELDTNPIQFVDEVHIHRTLYSSSSAEESSDANWLVAWASGIENKTLSMTNEQDGALPIGAIALPFNHSECVPYPLTDLPEGFYKEGHFYFYLPLPISHQFPFHVNGAFLVSSDRRSFRVVTEDDTSAKFGDWNVCLLGDSIVEAIMLVFKALKSLHIAPEFKAHSIWPLPTPDVASNTMVEQFYIKMLNGNLHKTFKVDESWLDISQIKLLNPDLKYDPIIGRFAFDILSKYLQNDVAVDIPKEIYLQMLKTDASVTDKRTIAIEEFVREFFLPNIGNLEQISLRDKLTRFALEQRHPHVDKMMSENNCIPTKPHGRLRCAKDIVQSNSFISSLFNDDDECFVTEEFQDEKIRVRLKEVGMNVETLNDKDLLERMQSVSRLNEVCSECALERCFHLLHYLEKNFDRHRNLIDQLPNEPFLPVLQYHTNDTRNEPMTASCSNHTTDRQFENKIPTEFNIVEYKNNIFISEDKRMKKDRRVILSPSEVHSEKHKSTIGSVIAVIDCSLFVRLSELFRWDSEPQLEHIVEHLHHVVQSYTDTNKHIILGIIKDLYQKLSEEYKAEEVKVKLQDRFSDLHQAYIWFGDGFVEPQRIFVDHGCNDIDLSPYLRPLPSELSEFKNFFKALGCFSSIDFNAYLNILEKIKNECQQHKEIATVQYMRRIAVSIINELKDNYLEHVQESKQSVYFPVHTPDNTLLLKSADECVFCDAQWLNECDLFNDEDELMFVHNDVSNSTAETLGVSSLTDKVFSNAEAMEEWGQEEPLTRRLKNIVKEGYVDGFSVPKELFQNADDAGATKLLMMYDKRENEDSKQNLLSEGMAQWQGPALWVYNNAEFTEEDFRNITKLSGATKENDSCKIGKFGLGFCAIYNLTDVPSFISGDNIVVFDPHMKHLGKAMPGKSPGLRINLSKIKNKTMINKVNAQFRPYENVFGCRLVSNEKSHFHGTLFRFPLRNQPSDISDKVYTQEDMKDFLDKTVESAANLFLFNMNIEELKLYVLDKDEMDPSNSKLVFEANKRVHHVTPSVSGLSLLHDVTQRKKGILLKQNQLKALQKVNIGRTIVDDDSSVSSSTSWLVSWASGIEDETLEMTYREKGAVPLCGVAIPYDEEDGEISPKQLQVLPQGFYDKGHFFFFLPMPIEHSFPFHMNGPFAISSDRRKLRAMSDDDFDSKFEKWNLCLLGDSLVQALVNMCQMMEELQPSAKYMFYDYWPLEESKMVNELPVRFYKKIFESPEPRIFYSCGRWINIHECLFLASEMRCNNIVGTSAFNVLARFVEENCAVDVPLKFYELLVKTNDNVMKSRTVSTKSLVSEFFLPNIENLEQCISESERDDLTIFSLRLRTPEVDDKLKETLCIPTKPNASLRHIKELVDKDSLIAPLFDEKDCRFPTDEFQTAEIHSRLKELGMMSQHLPEMLLLEKARSVPIIAESCFQCATDRCNYLLKYLKRAELDEETLRSLQQIPFLPVKCKPKNWPFKWHTQEGKRCENVEVSCEKHGSSDKIVIFMQPVEIFSHKSQNLVGCVQPVIDEEVSRSVDNAFFSCLGMRNVATDLTCAEVVIAQLTELVHTINISENTGTIVTDIVTEIYMYLNKACDNQTIEQLISKKLVKAQVLWVGGVFTSSEKVAQKDKRQCPPYLHSLSGNQLSKCEKLCTALKISVNFKPKYIAHVLHEIHMKYQNQPLSDEDLDNCVTLLDMLHVSMKESAIFDVRKLFDETVKAIYAPDEDKVLHPTRSMCFNDFDAIEKSDTMIYVHDSISPKIAKTFGVKPKLIQNLEDISEDIEDFYQEEHLTTRIRGLLDGYPCDSSVFKELLQNADDACASEVHMIFDTTTHSSKNVFAERFKPLQGPALVVFNNKEFTPEDLKGIQNLGSGSKRDDPSKTGRYGVGFNAVYNITDAPSFLTFGSQVENGETLCFFDPHAKYIPNVTRKKPGKRYKNTKSIHDHHSDVLLGYHREAFGQQTTGTIFRLPLRSKQMAEKSDIKKEEITGSLITSMLKEFETELKYMLIFLKKVQKVTVSSYRDNKVTEEYSIDINMSKDDESKRNSFFQYFQDVCKRDKQSILEIEQKTVSYCLSVTENASPIAIYNVVQVLGSETPKLVPGILKENMLNGNLGLLPYGGVALAYTHKKKNIELCERSGRAFCFLPLPVHTGLPVNVNGYFALSDEKRRSLWYDTGDNCYKTQWNKFLIKNIITPAYITLLERMRQGLFKTNERKSPKVKQLEHKLKTFFEMFPCYNVTGDRYWAMLANNVFLSLVTNNITFLPITSLNLQSERRSIESVTWTSLFVPDYHFPAYAEIKDEPVTPWATEHHVLQKRQTNKQDTLNAILKKLGLRVVSVPEKIEKCLQQCKFPLSHLDNADMIDFLCSTNSDLADRCRLVTNMAVESSLVGCLENCRMLINFCKDSKHLYCNFTKFPLLLSQHGNLKSLGTDTFMYWSLYTDFFPEEQDSFLHESIYIMFQPRYTSGALRVFSLEDFVLLLKRSELNHLVDECVTNWNKVAPSFTWISKFWNFFWHLDRLIRDDMQKRNEHFDKYSRMVKSISLLPVTVFTSGEPSRIDLIPVGQIDAVINLDSFKGKTLHKAVKKFMLLELDLECFGECRKMADMLVEQIPGFNFPVKVLHCLLKNRIKVKQAHISNEESLSVLAYFFQHLEETGIEENISLVRQLELFVTYDGRRVDLESFQSVVVAPDGMPNEGLEFFTDQTEVVLLKRSEVYKKFEDLLSFQKMSVAELYMRYIFPNRHTMDTPVFYHHIDFIAMRYTKGKFDESEKEKLFAVLSDMAFIELSNGSFCKVSDLFNSSIDIFKIFCRESEFLPQKFRGWQYSDFFPKLGLKGTMDVGLFERFAEQISRSDATKKDVKEMSKLLAKTLIKMPLEFFSHSDLSRFSEIEFIVPDKIDPSLLKLCDQHPRNKFICYANSVLPEKVKLCWTTSLTIPEFAKPKPFVNNTTILQKLRIATCPRMGDFVRHCDTVCKSVMEKKRANGKIDWNVLEMVMIAIYKEFEHLKQTDVINATHTQSLKATPIILFPETEMLHTADTVVLECHTEEEISPYLNRIPPRFSLFQKVFFFLGAVKSPSIQSYAMVLKTIKSVNGNEKLLPDELDRTKVAVSNLVKFLTNHPVRQVVECGELFLPDTTHKMETSQSLILCNNNYIRKRLRNRFTIRFFIGFEKLDIKEDLGIESFMKLSETVRPQLLTDIIGEEIVMEGIKLKDNIVSRDLERFINSEDFTSGTLRLAKHTFTASKIKWTDDRETMFIAEMKRIRVRNVAGMNTILIQKKNGRKIDRTEHQKSFYMEETEAAVTVYIESQSNQRWFADFKKDFALHVNKLFECCFKDRTFLLLVDLIDAKDHPESISDILDRQNIDAYSLRQALYCPDFPKPGEYVPEEYHQYLDNDNGIIHVHDYRYVAYVLEDPLVEDMSDEKPVYVYAEIKRKLESESSVPLLQYYEVDIGEEEFVRVPAFKLYKFIRKEQQRNDVSAVVIYSRNETSDTGSTEPATTKRKMTMKEVCKEIRKTLEEAWREDKKERRGIVLRLMRKWHPDKNMDDFEFCNKVFQYIQQCITNLESGRKIPDNDSDDEESSGRPGGSGSGFHWQSGANSSWDWDTFWDSYQRRRRRDYERRSSSGFSFDFSSSSAFSHPREAKRWQQQAKFDLESAKDCEGMHPNPAFNWICYKCHQAAEKSLTAAWYSKNANHVRLIKHSHDLTDIARGLSDHIQGLASRLTDQTGAARRMRYPSELSGQSIPATQYTRHEARESCQLAERLLSETSSEYGLN